MPIYSSVGQSQRRQVPFSKYVPGTDPVNFDLREPYPAVDQDPRFTDPIAMRRYLQQTRGAQDAQVARLNRQSAALGSPASIQQQTGYIKDDTRALTGRMGMLDRYNAGGQGVVNTRTAGTGGAGIGGPSTFIDTAAMPRRPISSRSIAPERRPYDPTNPDDANMMEREAMAKAGYPPELIRAKLMESKLAKAGRAKKFRDVADETALTGFTPREKAEFDQTDRAITANYGGKGGNVGKAQGSQYSPEQKAIIDEMAGLNKATVPDTARLAALQGRLDKSFETTPTQAAAAPVAAPPVPDIDKALSYGGNLYTAARGGDPEAARIAGLYPQRQRPISQPKVAAVPPQPEVATPVDQEIQPEVAAPVPVTQPEQAPLSARAFGAGVRDVVRQVLSAPGRAMDYVGGAIQSGVRAGQEFVGGLTGEEYQGPSTPAQIATSQRLLAEANRPDLARLAAAGDQAANAELDRMAGGGQAGQTGMAQQGIPPDAAEYLKQNPQFRQQFDLKYGAGASASILGG